MDETDYNTWQGRKVENVRTHRIVTVWDIQHECIHLSNGAMIPFDAIPGHWVLVEEVAK